MASDSHRYLMLCQNFLKSRVIAMHGGGPYLVLAPRRQDDGGAELVRAAVVRPCLKPQTV